MMKSPIWVVLSTVSRLMGSFSPSRNPFRTVCSFGRCLSVGRAVRRREITTGCSPVALYASHTPFPFSSHFIFHFSTSFYLSPPRRMIFFLRKRNSITQRCWEPCEAVRRTPRCGPHSLHTPTLSTFITFIY